MKSKASQQVRVGMFVTLGLILSMVAIFLLGDISGLFERQYTLYARFNEVSGLRMGAPIFLGGINIGKVEGIRFPKSINERKIVVTLQVRKEYKDRIREDSRASVVTQGLLGDKAVSVTVGSDDAKVIENGGEVPAKEGLSMENFSEKAGELLNNVNKLADNLNKVIEDVKGEDSLVHALLYDPEGKKVVKDLANITGSASRIMAQIQKGDGVLHSLIYDKKSSVRFSKTMENFEGVSANLKDVSKKIEQGEGSVGGLINDPTVYYDLMTLLGNANRNKLLRTVIRATLATNESDLIDE